MNIPSLLSQFGTGFEPISPLTEDSGTNEGALKNMETIISLGLGLLTILGSLFFIFYFFTATYKILTAGGDSGKLSAAWNQMIYGVLGLIILVAAYAIVGLIGSIVGIDVLNPGEMIKNIAPTP